jgi:hypothetical protein
MIDKRLQRWVRGSIQLEPLEPLTMITLQGLGHLDLTLIARDQRLASLMEARPGIRTQERLLQQITLSYLWVLGVYELVRTLHERSREDTNLLAQSIRGRLEEMKHALERLRIPLAKHQHARRYPADNPLAWPAFDPDRGVLWSVGQQSISRRELSDKLLDLLDGIEFRA